MLDLGLWRWHVNQTRRRLARWTWDHVPGAGALADAIQWRFDRFRCRRWQVHGAGCRGRQDHIVPETRQLVPGRWVG